MKDGAWEAGRKEIEVYERWERMTGTTINFPGGISFGTAVALRLKLYYSLAIHRKLRHTGHVR